VPVLTRVPPRLAPELEAIVTRTIGCALRVHQTLGPGYSEAVYHDAMAIELEVSGIPYSRELLIPVSYRGRRLRDYKLDLVVDGILVVEIKAVEKLHPIHQAQILSYMKAGHLPVGLLMNFQTLYLRSQLRRLVL
jgi:GxxExxY protein